LKKVAHVCTTSLSHKILVDKLALLQKRGYEIHLVSSREGYDENLLENYNFKIKFVEMCREINLLKDLYSIFLMYKLIKKEKYDIVHTHTAKAGIIGRIAATLARIPLVIHTSHGLPFYPGQSKTKYHIYRFLEKVGSLFCHAIASQNKEDMKKIKEIAFKRTKVLYEGNGVDLARLDNIAEQISSDILEEIKKKWGIDSSKKVLLMGARFEPVKDHFFLIDSLYELKKQYRDDFICLLAGKGELEGLIRKKIDDLNLSSNVKIVGHQPNIYPYIYLSDIVVLTSEKEGIPRILMEAMSFRKPVVASNVLGTRELVVQGVSGYLVQYKDVNSFAKCINQLLDNPELMKRFGENGRKIIEKEYTEDIVVDRIVQMYESL
jgi:glycosyltransferase involved in cell wall biosynthesis